MSKPKESIIFFGSGPVAARSLSLLAQDFEIEVVITKPKPSHHRGEFPALLAASELDLPILTPANKQELSDLFAGPPLKSRLGVVIDYGIIIPQAVIDFFPLGIVNSHFSLLPEWRGADPISFAILSGQKRTGVSLMLITAGLDEGPLLAQAPYDIPPRSTTPELTEALIDLSHQCLRQILPEYMEGALVPAPQQAVTIAETMEPTYSRKLTKEDGVIDWRKPADQIEREIRAFIEWPKSRTTIGGKEVIITRARAEQRTISDEKGAETGNIAVTADKELAVQAGDGLLIIERLKPAGKREMSAREFIAGYGTLL